MSKPTTLYDKIWDDHLVHEADDGTCLLYIDRHLVHEVTSPQAFEGLRATGRKVHAPEKRTGTYGDDRAWCDPGITRAPAPFAPSRNYSAA